MHTLRLMVYCLLLGFLVACESGPTKDQESGAIVIEGSEGAADADSKEPGDKGAQTSGLPGEKGLSLDPLNDPASPLANRVIYFEYNKSVVSEQAQALVGKHARYLALNPNLIIKLEGHADERGTREYNIGLGDRRVQAIRRLLLFQGVSDRQIQSVSYGEERPAASGHDEDAWRLNRRVELIYSR